MSANDMDDMFLQCNKNAIYVLNSSYAYGEFGRLNLFGTPVANGLEISSHGGSCYPRDSFYRHTSSSNISNLVASSKTSSSRMSPSAPSTLSSSANRSSGQTKIGTTGPVLGTSASTNAIPKLFSYSYCDEKQHPYPASVQQNLSKCKTNSSAMTTKKGSAAIKSTIIAKKTKFWKYLEEEKWKKNSIENLSSTNCERNSDGKFVKGNTSISSNTTTTTNTINNNNRNWTNKNSNNNNNNNSKSRSGRNSPIPQGNNSHHQKSSTELYREAAQLLGLSCTLCDNCRCLDCQSRYFECDDSDTYSEISFMGDYCDSGLLDQQQPHHQQQNFTEKCYFSNDNQYDDDDSGNLDACSKSNELTNCESLSDLSIEDNDATAGESRQKD